MHEQWIQPDWPVSPNVRAVITTRTGGVSTGPYGVPPEMREGMNIGLSTGDVAANVQANRTRLRAYLPAEPRWLNQVHSAGVVDATRIVDNGTNQADASFTDVANVVCTVLVADCMPVLLADTAGQCVGIAHAGWRGLAAGIIQATAQAMQRRVERAGSELLAYLGPAIGPRHFEVGAEVLDAMRKCLPRAESAFIALGDGKYRADLFALGRLALGAAGVTRIYGGQDCTFSDARRFYSFRRDRITGRHAALIWRV